MDEIKQMVQQAIGEAIRMHNQGPMNTTEAAEYLRISKRKMQDLIPYIKYSIVGGRRIFTKSDLDAFIEENRV